MNHADDVQYSHKPYYLLGYIILLFIFINLFIDRLVLIYYVYINNQRIKNSIGTFYLILQNLRVT